VPPYYADKPELRRQREATRKDIRPRGRVCGHRSSLDPRGSHPGQLLPCDNRQRRGAGRGRRLLLRVSGHPVRGGAGRQPAMEAASARSGLGAGNVECDRCGTELSFHPTTRKQWGSGHRGLPETEHLDARSCAALAGARDRVDSHRRLPGRLREHRGQQPPEDGGTDWRDRRRRQLSPRAIRFHGPSRPDC
jgi:hypothetical protein